MNMILTPELLRKEITCSIYYFVVELFFYLISIAAFIFICITINESEVVLALIENIYLNNKKTAISYVLVWPVNNTCTTSLSEFISPGNYIWIHPSSCESTNSDSGNIYLLCFIGFILCGLTFHLMYLVHQIFIMKKELNSRGFSSQVDDQEIIVNN
jgi:hypothetical protein